MNTHDHDHDHDELPGEAELKALYRSLPRKEPSPALDATIRRAAAEAARPSSRRVVTRWPVAVASTAMVIVAAGLGWRMLQQPSSVPQVPTHALVTASPTTNIAAQPAPAAVPQAAPTMSTLPAMATADARTLTPAPAKRESIRSAVKPKIVAPVVATEQAPVAAAEPAPMTAASEDAAARATAPPAPAPPAPPSPSAEDTIAAAPATEPAAPQAFRASSAIKAMAAPAPAAMLAGNATAPAATDTPAQEFAKIRLLLAQQHRDEAVQRLLAFRKSHPDSALPDDLRALLPDHE